MVSGPQILVIAIVIVLFIFGPKSLPGLGRSLGDAIRGFKKGISGDDEEIDVTDSAREQIQKGEESQAARAKQTEKENV